MPRPIIHLGLVGFVLAFAISARADSPAEPVPHVTTSPQGGYIFCMVPKHEYPPYKELSYGIAYQLLSSGELAELWRTKDWYSFKVFLADDGRHLVRMGPWNVGHDPEPDHLAVAFYRDGQLIKQYSTAELVKDHSRIQISASHYQWLAGRDEKAEPPSLDWKSRFSLSTVDGIEYLFDVTTGAILSTETEEDRAAGWASIREIDRLCIAVSLAEYPFPYSKINEVIGLPKKAWSNESGYGDTTVFQQLVLSDPQSPGGYYAMAVEIYTGDRGEKRYSAPIDGDVTSLKLFYFTPDRRKMEYRPQELLTDFLERLRNEPAQENDTPRIISERAVKRLNTRRIFER
jgi:hypothetical protein